MTDTEPADREGLVTGRWVRISDLHRVGAQATSLLATTMTDLAVAQSLVLIHGKERGIARYIEAGGRVRFDGDGEPVIWDEVGHD
jgi:hypothetical protein